MNPIQRAAQRLIEQERLSLRAVIVPDGVDPGPYLLEAGITQPVSVPFATAPGDRTGAQPDGWAPGVPATFEPVRPRPAAAPETGIREASSGDDEAEGDETGPERRTANLPAAFGMRPLAPVWRLV